MTCIHTGCDVWLDSQEAMLHGDLYHIKGVYVLDHTGVYLHSEDKAQANYIFHDYFSRNSIQEVGRVIVILSDLVDIQHPLEVKSCGS